MLSDSNCGLGTKFSSENTALIFSSFESLRLKLSYRDPMTLCASKQFNIFLAKFFLP